MAFESLENVFNNRKTRYPEWEHDISENTNNTDTVSDNLFNHSFGTNNKYDDIIEIIPIQNEQSPSPLMAIAGIGDTGDTSVNGHSRGLIRVNYEGALLQTNIDLNQKENYPYSELILATPKPDLKAKNLGNGKFTIQSLFDQSHGSNTPIREGFGEPHKLSSDLQLHQSPHGPVGSLDIKSTQGYGGRGGEPHIVHPIGFSSSNAKKRGYDRDGFPLRATGEDVSRLLNYYLSADGIQFMLKENVTNVAVGDGLTLAEPSRFLMLPPLPVPMTGFLNTYQQKMQANFPDLPPFQVVRGKFAGQVIFDPAGREGLSNRKPGRQNYSDLVSKKHLLVLKRHGDLANKIVIEKNPLERFLFDDHELTPVIKNTKKAGGVRSGREEATKLTIGDRVSNAGTHLGNLGRAANALRKKARNALLNKAIDAMGALSSLPPTDQPTKRFLDLSGKGNHAPNLLGEKSHGYNDEIAKSAVQEGGDTPLGDLGTSVPPLENEKIDQGDFYVRIRDVRNNKYIYFRGYVTGITENVTPTWNPVHYVGRSEDVWTYSKAERDLSFNLRLAPQNQVEFQMMYSKMQYLTGLAYPTYFQDQNGISPRMQPPFTELYMAHIGSKAIGQFGYIKSLTYTVNDQGDWDALTNLSRLIDVAISYQLINKETPSTTTQFYRLKQGGSGDVTTLPEIPDFPQLSLNDIATPADQEIPNFS